MGLSPVKHTARAALTVCAALLILRGSADPQPSPPKPPQARMDASDHSAGWVGRTAAPFALAGTGGQIVDLKPLIGVKPFAIIFYRGVWCPFCQSQMDDLSRHRSEFQKLGLPVYAVSNEAAPALSEMQKRHALDFVTFLSDPTGAAAKLYSGLYPRSTVHQPGVFVVDRHGRIAYAYVNQDFKTRADTATFLAVLRKVGTASD